MLKMRSRMIKCMGNMRHIEMKIKVQDWDISYMQWRKLKLLCFIKVIFYYAVSGCEEIVMVEVKGLRRCKKEKFL
jgi:hypothetical protein